MRLSQLAYRRLRIATVGVCIDAIKHRRAQNVAAPATEPWPAAVQVRYAAARRPRASSVFWCRVLGDDYYSALRRVAAQQRR
jgi:hypothetical protein